MRGFSCLFVFYLLALVAGAGTHVLSADTKHPEAKRVGGSNDGSASDIADSREPPPHPQVNYNLPNASASAEEAGRGGGSVISRISDSIRRAGLRLDVLETGVWDVWILLMGVLVVAVFTLVLSLYLVWGAQKAHPTPVSYKMEFSRVFQELNNLKRLVSDLSADVSEIKNVRQRLDGDNRSEMTAIVSTPLIVDKEPTSVLEQASLKPSEPELRTHPKYVSNASIDDITNIASSLGEIFREAILQNNGKFQGGWETFKRSLGQQQIEAEDVWYDLLANEKVLTSQPASMNTSIHCRVLLMESSGLGRSGLLFISHIGQLTPRSEDFPFCDVRTDGTIMRDRLGMYLPPVVFHTPGQGWKVARRGTIEYY